MNPDVLTISTFRSLLETQHEVDLYCPRCQRRTKLDLVRLVARGAGERTLQNATFRCEQCGGKGEPRLLAPTYRDSGGRPVRLK